MSCTTILVGKKASYDGSTIIARTEDSQSGDFTPKQFIVIIVLIRMQWLLSYKDRK